MKNYRVSVEKRMYCTGVVIAKGNNPDQAIQKVKSQIAKGTLQTTDVDWDDLVYEDCSFETTGDID